MWSKVIISVISYCVGFCVGLNNVDARAEALVKIIRATPPLATRITDFLFEFDMEWREKFAELGTGRFIACSPDRHSDAPLHCEMKLLCENGFPSDYIDRDTIIVDTIGYRKVNGRDVSALLIAINIFVRLYFYAEGLEQDLYSAVSRKFAELCVDFTKNSFRVNWTKDNVDEDLANRNESKRLMSQDELMGMMWDDLQNRGVNINDLHEHVRSHMRAVALLTGNLVDSDGSGDESADDEVEFIPPPIPL